MTKSKGKFTVKNILKYVALTTTLLTLAACGGSGGGETTHTPSTATLKISLTGTLPDSSTTISGAAFTVILPANVTSSMTNGTVAADVVSYSGTFAGSTLSPQAVYTPATSTTAGSLNVILTSSAATGVNQVGEVATITLQIANGATPTASSFGLNAVGVYDAALIDPISGMGVSVTGVTLQ
jgi:hypothetical protein